jgi:hypothetical protein
MCYININSNGEYIMELQTTLTIIEKLEAIQAFANGHHISVDHLNSMIGTLRIELQKEAWRQEELMITEMFLQDSDGMSCLGVQLRDAA